MGLGRSKMLLLRVKRDRYGDGDRDIGGTYHIEQSPELTWWHCRAVARARDLVASARWW